MTIKNTAKIVKKILQEQPETRGDDYLLWLKVIEEETSGDVLGIANLAPISRTLTVEEFLQTAKKRGVPCFETVSRARRKLQAKYPELRATKPVQEARAEKEVEYIEFARSEAI